MKMSQLILLCLYGLLLWVAIGFGVYLALTKSPVTWRDPDPYACFGAGRYDAMRDGRVCPGRSLEND